MLVIAIERLQSLNHVRLSHVATDNFISSNELSSLSHKHVTPERTKKKVKS